VHVRLRRTFDSSATPTSGGSLRAPTAARKPDLEVYRQRMAETIERAEAEDPKKLRAKIAELERQTKQAPKAAPKRVEVPVIRTKELKRLEALLRLYDKATASLFQAYDRAAPLIDALVSVRDSLPGMIEATKAQARGLQESMTPAPRGPEPPSGPRTPTPARGERSAARSAPATASVSTTPETPLTAADLHERVMARLNGPQQKILGPLLAAYPDAVDNDDLARQAGYEPSGGAYNNPRGRLRTLGLIEYPEPGKVRARGLLFLE
jgi:hypothetical protein